MSKRENDYNIEGKGEANKSVVEADTCVRLFGRRVLLGCQMSASYERG